MLSGRSGDDGAIGEQGYNNRMRLVGERKACAAAVLGFFATIFFLNGVAGPPEFMAMFLGLALAYLAGFFGVVAGWFWARWYGLGLAFSGVLIGAMLWWQIGLEPIVMIYGGSHLAVGLALWGRGMATAFDGRTDWRQRWRMDENAANRLGKAVMRAGASLPYLIMAGLAPKQDLALVAAALLAGVGVFGLVRLRTWGLIAVGAASILAVVGAWPLGGFGIASASAGLGALFAAAAFAPFAASVGRALLDGRPRRC